MNNSWLREEEYWGLGLKHIGKNCKISRFARFYSPNTISIGDNCRIDDFCILSGVIEMGNYVHLAAFACIYAHVLVEMKDYSAISCHSVIYSGSDDYGGDWLTNPTVKAELRRTVKEPVYVGKHCVIGSGSVILPGAYLADGSAVGCMSMVKNGMHTGIIAGVPAKFIRFRTRGIFDLERENEL